MKKLLKVYQKDKMEHIENLNLVQLSRDLLEAMVESTAIMEGRKMTEQGLKEAKIVLGYLNAANANVKTRIGWFRMQGLEDKVKKVRERTEKVAQLR